MYTEAHEHFRHCCVGGSPVVGASVYRMPLDFRLRGNDELLKFKF